MIKIGVTRSKKIVKYTVEKSHNVIFRDAYQDQFSTDDWFDAMAMFEAGYADLEDSDAIELRKVFGRLGLLCRKMLEIRGELFKCMKSANCSQIIDILNYGRCLISESDIAKYTRGSSSPKARK